MLSKALKCGVGTLEVVKRLQRGNILVQTTNKSYSESLLKLTNLADVPVRCTAHRTLNSSKGVVRCRDLTLCNKQEIIDELQSQGVSDVFNITVRTDNSEQRRSTNTFILTFSMTKPPEFIYVGHLRVAVSLYIPNPLRCFKCQKYGHGKTTCKGQVVCSRCGSIGHDDRDCQAETKCANCGGNHTAFAKECPTWVKEKQVQQVKAVGGISFVEARKLVQSGQTATGRRSTAAVVVSKPPVTVQLQRTSKPTTRTTGMQTDLTWPENLLVPIRTKDDATHREQGQQTVDQSDCSVFIQPTVPYRKPSISPNKSSSSTAHPEPPARRGGRGGCGGASSRGGSQQNPKIIRPPSLSQDHSLKTTNKYAALEQDRIEEESLRMDSDDCDEAPPWTSLK